MSEPYIIRHGDTLYRVTAASASLATVEVLASIGDPSIWRGELETFTEPCYREIYGDPDDVVDIPDGAGTGRVQSVADAGPYGETMRDKRRRWEAQGDCRDCGARGPHRLPDGKLTKRCARCRRGRSSRAPGSGRVRRSEGKA